jgi:hypothetical protein
LTRAEEETVVKATEHPELGPGEAVGEGGLEVERLGGVTRLPALALTDLHEDRQLEELAHFAIARLG